MASAAKKVFIVYAHQSPGSFNSAAKDVAVEVLTAQGHTVKVSDLYAMKFKASATAEDIIGEVKQTEPFSYPKETKTAWENGKLSADITEEQCKLSEADLIIFQFPMYWFGLPAILKGWIDRVLTPGYAHSKEKHFSQGVFKNGILHYCGFQVLPPQIFWAPARLPQEGSAAMLQAWRHRLDALMGEAPLCFTPMDCFDSEKGFQLKKEVQEKQADKKVGLTVGIHMGMPVPPNNQMIAGV
ncbi:NAD(P)H dehydrogenase [quinone] 1-like isoform X2 [Stigmatopora argus]